MHHDVTLVAIKSSNKLKYLKLERKEIKSCKRSCYTVLKDLSNYRDKNFRVIYTLTYYYLSAILHVLYKCVGA